uniref:methyl-CpG-binding domain protein 6-like n=1 Tax=Callithrix jacchus TaxID=9483 RepID=UPI0023DD1258|nr:methyl-CpG-binding domain protein 6-like [Callithrix jacchus]
MVKQNGYVGKKYCFEHISYDWRRAESGRLAGPAIRGQHQAFADPGPVTCGESTPSPGLSALHADRIPNAAAAARPACENRARRQAPLGGRGAPAPSTGYNRRRRPSGAPRGGKVPVREGAGRLGEAGAARSYLTTSVSSVSSSTATAPAVAAAATFLGSAPAAATSSSTLCSPLPRRAHRAARPFSHLPPPSPTHKPRNPKPHSSRSLLTHPPSLPATSGGPVPPPFPSARRRAGLSNGGHSGSLALTDFSPSLPNFTSASLPARAATHPTGGGAAAQPGRDTRARARTRVARPTILRPRPLTSRRLPRRAPSTAPPLPSSPGSLGRLKRSRRR